MLSLQWVLSEVRSNNPALKAARANWQAMVARVPQARAWQDPKAGLDIEGYGTTRSEAFTDIEWMIAQSLPLSGRNRQRARAASAEAEAALAEVRRREIDLIARARAAYYRYANAHAQLELNRKNETLLNEIAELAREKLRTGKRTEADALAAEAEVAELLERRLDIEQEISDQQSELNVLMNRPAHGELGRPLNLVFKPLVLPRYAPPPSLHGPGEIQFSLNWPLFQQQMQSLAVAERPELLGAQNRIQASEAGYSHARRAWIPDPEFRVEVRQFNGAAGGMSEYDVGLFFDIPWANRGKYKAAVEEASRNLATARHNLAALQSEALGMVRNQVKKIETLQNHYEFHRDRIVPLWQQTARAARPAYAADQVTVLELLTPQRQLWKAESVLQHHLADYWSAVAELEAVVGASFQSPSAVQEPPQSFER